jgi:hypothetical protein
LYIRIIDAVKDTLCARHIQRLANAYVLEMTRARNTSPIGIDACAEAYRVDGSDERCDAGEERNGELHFEVDCADWYWKNG